MPDATVTPALIDAAELARLLSVSKPTIWRMKDAGKLPPEIRLTSQTVRWHRATVITWIDNGCPAMNETPKQAGA